MRFSKPFIVLACTLLLLVGAALGYSAKLFHQMAGVDDELLASNPALVTGKLIKEKNQKVNKPPLHAKRS